MSTVPLPTVPAIATEGVSISEAADIVGVTVETLRYWEREGLTLAAADRTSAGWRRYSEADVAWLAGVVMLRGTGMSIRELREFSAAYRAGSSEQDRLALLEAHRARVVEQLARTGEHLRALDRKIDTYRRAIEAPRVLQKSR